MRTIDATLQAALNSGSFNAYIKIFFGTTERNVLSYKLTGTTLEAEIDGLNGTEAVLKRGVTIEGINYTLSTSKFFVDSREVTGFQSNNYDFKFKAHIIPNIYISIAGDDTYENVISAFCAEIGKTAVFQFPLDNLWQYQFLPTGKTVTLNNAQAFLNILAQKYFIHACDNGNDEILFYQGMRTSDSQYNLWQIDTAGDAEPGDIITNVPFKQPIKYGNQQREYIARDETNSTRTGGTAGKPLQNLGYLESTDAFPDKSTQEHLIETLPFLINLNAQNGDTVTADPNIIGILLSPIEVIEEYNKKNNPSWAVTIKQAEIFTNTAGGGLPSTIERVAAYTPLVSSGFNGNLTPAVNNLQALAEAVDNLVGYEGPPGPTGATGPAGADGIMQSVVAGTNISVDVTDPANPIVSADMYTDAEAQAATAALLLNTTTIEWTYTPGVKIEAAVKSGVFADYSHTHTASQITDFTTAVQTIGDSRYATVSHTHAFTALTGVPASISANQLLQGNSAGTALEFIGFGPKIHALSTKATPDNADEISLSNSATSFTTAVRTTLTQFKAFLKTYNDTLYQAAGSYAAYSHTHTASQITDFTTAVQTIGDSRYATASHTHAATDITSGTLADARLSSNVALENVANIFTAAQTISVNSTTALKIDQSSNNAFIVDTTNKRLGIGTAPSFRLHAVNTVDGSDYFYIKNDSAGTNAITGFAAVGNVAGVAFRTFGSNYAGAAGAQYANSGQIRTDAGLVNGFFFSTGGASAPIHFAVTDVEVCLFSQTTQTVLISAYSASVKGLVVRGAASQTGAIQQHQDSGSTIHNEFFVAHASNVYETIFNKDGSANLDFGVKTDSYYGVQIDASDDAIYLAKNATAKLSFHAATPIAQQVFATGAGHTVDELITVLQNLGLVRQS